MILGIVIAVLIVILAIAIKAGWRPSLPDATSTSSTTPTQTGRPTTTTSGSKSSGPFGLIVRTLVVLVLLGLLFSMGTCAYEKWFKAPIPTTKKQSIEEYPRSGDGIAKKGVGLKAWLDPATTHTRPSDEAKYCESENPNICFKDLKGPINTNHEEWSRYPAGRYVVYPIEEDEIHFRWWQ